MSDLAIEGEDDIEGDGCPAPEIAMYVILVDDDLTDEPLPDEEDRGERNVPDAPTVPGTGAARLHKYWTRGPGLAKWVGHPHEWTSLYHHLLKYIKNPEKAKATAAKWFHDVKHFYPGSKHNRSTERDELQRRIRAVKYRLEA